MFHDEITHVRSCENMQKLIVSSSATIQPKNVIFQEYPICEEKSFPLIHKITVDTGEVKMVTYAKEDMLRFILGNDSSPKVMVFNIPFRVSNRRTGANFYIILIFHKTKRKIYVLNQYIDEYTGILKAAFKKNFSKKLEITKYKFSKSSPIKFLTSTDKKNLSRKSVQDKLLLINEKLSAMSADRSSACVIS